MRTRIVLSLLSLAALSLPASGQFVGPVGTPGSPAGNSNPSIASGTYFEPAGPQHLSVVLTTAGSGFDAQMGVTTLAPSWTCPPGSPTPNCIQSLVGLLGPNPFSIRASFTGTRFVLTAAEVSFGGVGSSTIHVAVSSGVGHPLNLANWTSYQLPAVIPVGASTAYISTLNVGIDDQAVYLTANLFDFNTFAFVGVLYRVIDKASLLAGSVFFNDIVVPTVGLPYASPAPAVNNGPSGLQRMYFVSAYLPGPGVSAGTIRIETINNPLSPALSLSSVDVPVAPYYVPPGAGAPQIACAAGPTPPLSTLDGRIGSAAYQDCYIYAAHTIMKGPSSPRHLVKWYQFEANGWDGTGATNSPVASQQARLNGSEIALPGEAPDVFFPAIIANNDETVGLVCNISSTMRPVGVYFTGREKYDKRRAMAPLQQLQASTGCYSAGTSPQLFGECAIAVDRGLPSFTQGKYFFTAGQFSGADSTQWRIDVGQEAPPNVGPDTIGLPQGGFGGPCQ